MYCNPPPPLTAPGAVNVASFPIMTTAPAQVPHPGPDLMLGAEPPFIQQPLPQPTQQLLLQPSAVTTATGRVQFHDSRSEVRIASLACLSDELRNDIWYSPSDIDGMRSEVRDLCRFLRVNPQACAEEHTRGLELRISLERQCRKQLTVQGVVEAQRRCQDPTYLASLSQRCSMVPRDLALQQGRQDYSNIYAVVKNASVAAARAPDASTTNCASAQVATAADAMSNPFQNNGMSIDYSKNRMCAQGGGGSSDSNQNHPHNMMINNNSNQFQFSACPQGQMMGEVFQFSPSHLSQQQQQQYSASQFNGSFMDQQQPQHYPQPQQQQFCDSDAFDPIMMEPIPFASSMPSNGNQHQHHHQQQQQHQQYQLQQPLGPFFDDGSGKRSYENMYLEPAAVEDPQDRTVRRRLEGLANNNNLNI